MDKMQILSFVVDLFSENDSVLFICEGKVKVCEGLAVDLKMNLLSDVFIQWDCNQVCVSPAFSLAGHRSIKVWLS